MDRIVEHHVRYRTYDSGEIGSGVISAVTRKFVYSLAVAVACAAVLAGFFFDVNAMLALMALMGIVSIAVYVTSQGFERRFGIARGPLCKTKRAAVIVATVYGVLLAFFIVLVSAHRFITWDAFMNTGGFYAVGLPTILMLVLLLRALFTSK